MEIIVCSQCGFILHRGEELVTPRDVAKKYNGRCPKCSNQLSIRGARIQVVSKNRRGYA